MELIGQLIVLVLFWPFVAFCRALVGILHTTHSAALTRLQRIAALFLTLGVASILAMIVLATVSAGFWNCLYAFALGFACLSVAGVIGGHVEREAKKPAAKIDIQQ